MDRITALAAFVRTVELGSQAAASEDLGHLPRHDRPPHSAARGPPGRPPAQPHHPQAEPDRSRSGVLREVLRHPGATDRSRAGRDRASGGAARHPAGQRPDELRQPASGDGARRLLRAPPAGEDRSGAERPSGRSGGGRLRCRHQDRPAHRQQPDRTPAHPDPDRAMRIAGLSPPSRHAPGSRRPQRPQLPALRLCPRLRSTGCWSVPTAAKSPSASAGP